MLACTFALAFAGVVVGLGDAATVMVELALALLFEFSALLQADPKTAKARKVRKPIVRRISVPPVCNTPQKALGANFAWPGLQLTH
jgi:hypothetical protein